MKKSEFLIKLADLEVAFRFHYSGTGMLFRSYEKKTLPGDYCGEYLSADPEKIMSYARETGRSWEDSEYNCLLEVAANYLAEKDRPMFHGAAFICGEGAYILTAPSGTGKSTQYRNLKYLYGDRVRVINGDKPILGRGQEGEIIVFPSPWNGKERWAGSEHAPLKGMVLLEQGPCNILKTMGPGEAALPVLKEFLYTAPSRKSVHTVCRMADTIVRSVPLYHFENKGDLASSQMLFDCIRKLENL